MEAERQNLTIGKPKSSEGVNIEATTSFRETFRQPATFDDEKFLK